MKTTLYPWQSECLKAWISHDCHGIVNVVTGAGKTILAVAAMEQLKLPAEGAPAGQEPLHVKIVVPTTHLLSQWKNAILEYSGPPSVPREEIGYYYGARKDSPKGRSYMIYVINTARQCLARHILDDLKEGFPVLLVADECHHYASEENRKIFEFLPFLGSLKGRYSSLGLSATPQSFGYGSILVPGLGDEIYRYGFSDAARKKTISPFAIYHIGLSFDEEESAAYEELTDRITKTMGLLLNKLPHLKKLRGIQFFGALKLLAQDDNPAISSLANTLLTLTYQRKTLICTARSRLSCACALIGALGPRARIILFGERIEQADMAWRLLEQQYPGQTGRCHSGMGRQARQNALERYRNGEIRILISCRALDEGFDVPSAGVGIVLSSASVERQRIQRLGRILRLQPGKDIASLYYLHLECLSEREQYFDTLPEQAFSFNLSYVEPEGSFTFPEYEEAAIRVLTGFRQDAPGLDIRREAQKCLLEGMVRTDWLLGEVLGDGVWDRKIRSASTVHEKNYWICMREVGRHLYLFTQSP